MKLLKCYWRTWIIENGILEKLVLDLIVFSGVFFFDVIIIKCVEVVMVSLRNIWLGWIGSIRKRRIQVCWCSDGDELLLVDYRIDNIGNGCDFNVGNGSIGNVGCSWGELQCVHRLLQVRCWGWEANYQQSESVSPKWVLQTIRKSSMNQIQNLFSRSKNTFKMQVSLESQ